MLDFAIVGGGVAGAYCAYRLANTRRVALFEASDRIGGRLWSVPLKIGAGPAEIGGMYFRSNQYNVRSLIEHLALPWEPVEFTRAGQFVRGTSFPDADFASPTLPFNLLPSERKSGPAALLVHTLEQVVPGCTDLWPINRTDGRSAQATFQNLRAVRHNGRLLHEHSLWNVLADVISTEAHALLAATLGAALLFRNINAFDGVWGLLHELGDGRGLRLKDGYQQLPIELVRRAEEEGVEVKPQHRLRGIERHGEGFALTFEVAGGAEVVRHARHVILAMPQRALQLVQFDSALFNDSGAFASMRDGVVGPMRSCKVFLAYEKAWWPEERGDAAHVSARYTDLPMQQCYYFGRNAPDAAALLMAAYADDVSALFWAQFADRSDRFASAAVDPCDSEAMRVSDALVTSLRRQLGKMHGGDIAPAPDGALYFDWGRDPYGGAWHAWAPHVESWKIRPRMRQPNPRLDLFICGEAYSQRNGWVEGAINSAERTLERLGLSRPSWISDPDFQFETDDEGVADVNGNSPNVQRTVTRHGAAA